MTHEIKRDKPGNQERTPQQKQQGGQGDNKQQQQQNPRTPGQPGGGQPDVQEQMPARKIDRDHGDQRRNVDVEKE